MVLSYLTFVIIVSLLILLSIAFFTLLERKVLGYIQIRKGPNKVGVMGLPQPFADALKLFIKEHAHPRMANYIPFYFAPIFSLILALILWSLYPTSFSSVTLVFSVLLFLCISSLNVYATLSAGWFSNSKYSLIGSLRRIAQTISYEVSISLILLCVLLRQACFDLVRFLYRRVSWAAIILIPFFFFWFITILAETNRTPFDLAEGESELVSGFNTEYRSGPFALIFMAEYTSILAISIISVSVFRSSAGVYFGDLFTSVKIVFFGFLFIWIRGTLPRMRYDRLISLTWKVFLPFVLAGLIWICVVAML